MTVPSTTSTFGPLNGNGVTTSFGFSFRLDDYADVTAEAQIEVITTSSDGVDTVKTLTTDYTVSLNGDQDASPGGSVVFGTAPASGVTVRGRRLPNFTQQTALANQGAYNAEDVETQFDQVAKQILALLELSTRTVRAPVGETMDILTRASERASQSAAFDADGNLIAAEGTTGDVPVSAAWAAVIDKATIALGLTEAGFSAFVQTLLDDADAAAFLTSLGVSAFVQTILNDADAAAVRTTIGAQPVDATLSALAALTTAAGQYIRATGVDTFTMDSYATLASNIQNSFVSNTYTPTLTNGSNVAASTAYVCSYIRIGNTVFVSGRVDIDVTTGSTTTDLGMSLPIASALAATSDLGGVAAATGGAGISAFGISADITNDRAFISGLCSAATASVPFGFSFMYRVI